MSLLQWVDSAFNRPLRATYTAMVGVDDSSWQAQVDWRCASIVRFSALFYIIPMNRVGWALAMPVSQTLSTVSLFNCLYETSIILAVSVRVRVCMLVRAKKNEKLLTLSEIDATWYE